MDTFTLISWGVNGLLAIIMYLLRAAHSDLKEQVRENKQEIEKVRNSAMKKEDFLDFKQELWNRLDRFEDSVNAKLQTR